MVRRRKVAIMKVLVAMDDSKFSQAALQAVVSQIRPADAEVRVLHVVAPLTVSASPQMAAAYAPELQDQIKTGHELVDRAAETLRAEGFEVDTSVYQADIREGILESAAHWGADLIVLGSRGRKGLPRFLLGSAAEFVARHARCSVEIVRKQGKTGTGSARKPGQRKEGMRVLLAIDDSRFSEAATQAVIAQDLPQGAEVKVVHVVDLALPIPTSYAAGFRQESLKRGEELVRRTEQLLAKVGYKVLTAVGEGDPRAKIVDQAKRWNADLVILGSHGRKGMEHFLMGSVSEAVARYAPCSVYIVRIPAQAPASLSHEKRKDVGVLVDRTQMAAGMQPQRRTRVCNVCGKPYSSNICPTCADRIRAEAIARKKRKDKGEE
jgi:nucleotide-binding universal stress UspA family protein